MLQSISIFGVALLVLSLKELTVYSVIYAVIISSSLLYILVAPYFILRTLNIKTDSLSKRKFSLIRPILGTSVGIALFLYSIKILRNIESIEAFNDSYVMMASSVKKTIIAIAFFTLIIFIVRIGMLIIKSRSATGIDEA